MSRSRACWLVASLWGYQAGTSHFMLESVGLSLWRSLYLQGVITNPLTGENGDRGVSIPGPTQQETPKTLTLTLHPTQHYSPLTCYFLNMNSLWFHCPGIKSSISWLEQGRNSCRLSGLGNAISWERSSTHPPLLLSQLWELTGVSNSWAFPWFLEARWLASSP